MENLEAPWVGKSEEDYYDFEEETEEYVPEYYPEFDADFE